MTDGRWQMANGRWQMADGRWQMSDGRWRSYYVGHASLPFVICHSPLLSAIRGQASLERGSQRPSPTTNRANRATEMFSPVRELTARITSRTDFVSSLTNF